MAARRVYRRERGNVLSSSVVHVEHGSNDVAVFWFALLAARSRRDVVTVVHDVPKVVHAPGAGIIGGGTRWRDILAYRLLAPIGDAFLRGMYARRVAVALVLSDRARSAWTNHRPRQTMRLPLAGDAPPDAPAPSNGTHVLFAGYIAPSKGVDTLLGAWSRVSDARGMPLVIAGAANGSLDSVYVENLRAGVRASSNEVVWLGALDDDAFERAIADAAIVVVPYRRSNPASGIVLTAMAAGRAILGTDVPAVADSLTDELEAMIVPVDDIDALAAALTQVARRSRAARSTWRRRRRARCARAHLGRALLRAGECIFLGDRSPIEAVRT